MLWYGKLIDQLTDEELVKAYAKTSRDLKWAKKSIVEQRERFGDRREPYRGYLSHLEVGIAFLRVEVGRRRNERKKSRKAA